MVIAPPTSSVWFKSIHGSSIGSYSNYYLNKRNEQRPHHDHQSTSVVPYHSNFLTSHRRPQRMFIWLVPLPFPLIQQRAMDLFINCGKALPIFGVGLCWLHVAHCSTKRMVPFCNMGFAQNVCTPKVDYTPLNSNRPCQIGGWKITFHFFLQGLC